MANPQKENGYTSISNEIMDALAKIRINGEARQVLDVIFRKTYGFNKKEDAISLSQFSMATGLRRATVCRAINKLKLMGIITQKDNGIANIYRILKDYDTWKPLPKKIISPKIITQKDNDHYPKRESALPKKRHTITTITKDTITKDIGTSEQGSHNQEFLIKEIFKTFYENGNKGINFSNKTERLAAEWLIKEFGLEKTVNTIKFALRVSGQPYAPVITTPFQLKNNIAKLIAYYKREQEPKKGSVPKFNF